MKDCFGPSMLKRLAKLPIICSGISMGYAEEVDAYLTLMTDTMETESFAKCERNGVDQVKKESSERLASGHSPASSSSSSSRAQGVHNVLVHTKKIPGNCGSIYTHMYIASRFNSQDVCFGLFAPGLVVHDQRSGWVANMQAGLARVSNNVVFNQRGHKVAVVHQYDRFKDLQASYFKKFVFWSMPTEAETCAAFNVVKDTELFKKKCDLRVVSGHSPSHCCVSCSRNEQCKAFSFAGSQCFLKSCTTSTQRISVKGVHSGYLKTG